MTQVAVCASLEPSTAAAEPLPATVGASRWLSENASDAELMAQVKMGNVQAFETLVARHQDLLIGYLARMTNCRDRAEEYAQEAFFRLYKTAGRYHERGHLTAYLFRIATNLLRSDERRKKRWRMLEGILAREQPAGPESPQRALLHGEASSVVAAAIGELPPTFRAPLVLREIEGWAYAEIAEALDCRVGTIKSRINRAKARLREALEPYWEEGNGNETTS